MKLGFPKIENDSLQFKGNKTPKNHNAANTTRSYT